MMSHLIYIYTLCPLWFLNSQYDKLGLNICFENLQLGLNICFENLQLGLNVCFENLQMKILSFTFW